MGKIMNDQLSIYNTPEHSRMMTVKQVADALKVSEMSVLRYIKKTYPEKLQSGKKCLLNEVEVTAVKLNMQQNQHLNRSVELPKTDLEKELLIQQAMQFQAEKIEKLQMELENAKPKIEFHDNVEVSVNSITVAGMANLLTRNGFKIGQNNLFKWFYDNKYLISSDRPYQKYLDSGLIDKRLFDIESLKNVKEDI
jgi:phage antirepressor YoqD-like protein